MHSKALISFLFTLACAMAVPESCIFGINFEVGENCFLEGQEYCSANCSNILACTNGTYKVTETCANDTSCAWDSYTSEAKCMLESETIEPDTPGTASITSKSYSQCLFGVEVEVGEKCSLGGFEFCNADCSNILTCTNETYQRTETCESNSCDWNQDTGVARCTLQPGTIESDTPGATAIASDSNSECSPNFSIGASCGSDPALEGTMRCDDTCRNVGICHNGVFQVNSPCTPGRCQWNADSRLPFCV